MRTSRKDVASTLQGHGSKTPVVGRIVAPPKIHLPGTWRCDLIWEKKGGVSDGTKLRILIRDHPGLGWARNAMTRKKGKKRQEGKIDTGHGEEATWTQRQTLEGRVSKPRTAKRAGSHQKLGQRHGTGCPTDTSQLCRRLDFRLSASRIMTE